jgi:hypothetical protein
MFINISIWKPNTQPTIEILVVMQFRRQDRQSPAELPRMPRHFIPCSGGDRATFPADFGWTACMRVQYENLENPGNQQASMVEELASGFLFLSVTAWILLCVGEGSRRHDVVAWMRSARGW